MRRSFNTLSALVTEEMRREVPSGNLFAFIIKDRKRPERGRFAPPYKSYPGPDEP